MTDLEFREPIDIDLLERRREQTRRLRRLAPYLLVLAAVVTSAGAYVAQYQPLAPGSVFRHTSPCIRTVDVFRPHDDHHDVRVFANTCGEVGDRMELGFSIRNTGPLPVTVLGFGRDRRGWMFSENEVVTASTDNRSATIPFRPFTLRAGEERYIEYRATITGCSPSDEGSTSRSFGEPVRYRVGPFSRTDLFAGIQLVFSCPPDVP